MWCAYPLIRRSSSRLRGPSFRWRGRPDSPVPGLRVTRFVWSTRQWKGRFYRVPRTRGPQRAREQVKRRNVGPGRSEEGMGAQIPLHVGRGRRTAEPGNGGMWYELAPFRSEARAPESVPDRLGERGEPGLRRGAGPERAGSAARGKTPEAVQLHPERGRRHITQCGLDSVPRRAVDLPDEREGQMEAVAVQPTGASQPELQLVNGLPQWFGQLQRDKQARHGSSPRRAAAPDSFLWPHRPTPRLLNRVRENRVSILCHPLPADHAR